MVSSEGSYIMAKSLEVLTPSPIPPRASRFFSPHQRLKKRLPFFIWRASASAAANSAKTTPFQTRNPQNNANVTKAGKTKNLTVLGHTH